MHYFENNIPDKSGTPIKISENAFTNCESIRRSELSELSERTLSVMKRRMLLDFAGGTKANNKICVPAESAGISVTKNKLININPIRRLVHPGKAYIINTARFNDPSLAERRGSMIDVTRLIRVLHKFHMQIESILDGTLNDIRFLMEKIAKHDFRNVSCLMIVIMSHGYEGNIIAAKDGTYSLDRDIMCPILENPTLVSKQKIVVTEVCKGPVSPIILKPRASVIPSEFFHLHNCIGGFLGPDTGSVFIDILCDNLEKYGFEKDIFSIAMKVVADVKRKYGNFQIPMIHTNVTDEFIFGNYDPKQRSIEEHDKSPSSTYEKLT